MRVDDVTALMRAAIVIDDVDGQVAACPLT